MLADLAEITVCPSAFITEARQSLRDAEKRKYGMKISKKKKKKKKCSLPNKQGKNEDMTTFQTN